MKQKLIILIAIIIVLAVAIIIGAKSGGGGASAGNTEISNDGFVMEDTATVEVDIPDKGKKAKDTTDAAVDE